MKHCNLTCAQQVIFGNDPQELSIIIPASPSNPSSNPTLSTSKPNIRIISMLQLIYPLKMVIFYSFLRFTRGYQSWDFHWMFTINGASEIPHRVLALLRLTESLRIFFQDDGMMVEYSNNMIFFITKWHSAFPPAFLFLVDIPVVPHKAVAEVSEQETYRRRWLL